MTRRQANQDIYTLVADPVRREILDALMEREMSVNEIVGLFPISQSAVSQHLALLRTGGLVQARKEGRMVYYSIDPGPLKLLHDWITKYEKFWTERLDALGQLLLKRKMDGDPAGHQD